MYRSGFGARLRVLSLLIVFFVVSAAATAAPNKQQRWTLIELSALGPNGGTTPQGINNHGDIVGYSRTPEGFLHGFLWQGGSMQDLGRPPQGEPYSGAYGIADDGTVIANDNEGGSFIWKDGSWTNLTLNSVMRDINKKGVIVGSFMTQGGGGHAMMYSDGVVHDLGTLGTGIYSHAQAINDKGIIVGSADPGGPQGFHAFVYENGAMRDLGTLGGDMSIATDINSAGTIVGQAKDAGGRLVSFISDGVGMRPLFDAKATKHGAIAINNRGAVIGNIDATTYLYDEGVLTLLDSLAVFRDAGWTRVFAMDINDHGWITGWGSRAGGSVNGVGFVLIPQ
jgi:probable HAF family extracellular repeat protein